MACFVINDRYSLSLVLWLLVILPLSLAFPLLLVFLAADGSTTDCTCRATNHRTGGTPHGSTCGCTRCTAYHGAFLFTAPTVCASTTT